MARNSLRNAASAKTQNPLFPFYCLDCCSRAGCREVKITAACPRRASPGARSTLPRDLAGSSPSSMTGRFFALFYKNVNRVHLIFLRLAKFPSRAKKIDVLARIIFPAVFATFNFVYWTYYLLQVSFHKKYQS